MKVGDKIVFGSRGQFTGVVHNLANVTHVSVKDHNVNVPFKRIWVPLHGIRLWGTRLTDFTAEQVADGRALFEGAEWSGTTLWAWIEPGRMCGYIRAAIAFKAREKAARKARRKAKRKAKQDARERLDDCLSNIRIELTDIEAALSKL